MTARLHPSDLPRWMPSDFSTRQPLRVVVDSRLRTPPGARMLSLPGETVIACLSCASTTRAQALESAGAQVVRIPANRGRVDLCALMRWLAKREANEVLLETGPTLAGAAVTAGLVDELVLYMAPHLMGTGARGLFDLPGLTLMEHRIPLRFEDVRRIGPDLRLRLRPAPQSAEV